MDLEKLIKKHPNVSRVEIEKIRQKAPYLIYNEDGVVWVVEMLDADRENEKTNGRECITAGPLVQLLSVHFLPDNNKLIDQNKPLTIYGRIYAEFRDTNTGEMTVYDLYSRKFDDPQVLGPSGGPLALTGPVPGWPNEDCLPWDNNTRLVVDVFTGDEANNLNAEKYFCEDTTTDLEKVKVEYVYGELGSLALRYLSMPFAVYGYVKVDFIRRFFDEDLPSLFINVKGKIAARYGSNSSSQECSTTLFEKQSDNNEFERVEIGIRRSGGLGKMKLSRCWVGLPAYTSLVLDVDLSEFGTERKILKETVELRIEKDSASADDFIVDDDILVRVSLGCYSPSPQGRQQEYGMELDDDDNDDDDDDESSDDEMSSGDEQMDEATCVPVASSLNLSRPWVLHAHENIPCPTPSVEIFSIFIGRENYKPLQVYGSIQVSSQACKFYIFKRESKEETFGLSEHSKTIPVLDGSRAYEENDSLEVKIDLKDVESCLHIRGYANWEYRYRESNSIRVDKQMCSVVQGHKGCFAAIHYTMFESAVQANVEFLCIPNKNKNGEHVGDLVFPKVYGSLVAQYNNYDYTSRYNKDFYRIILFKRNQEDPAQPGNDGLITLSRSMVVVPLNSSLLIEANIGNEFSKQPLPSTMFEFQIGGNSYSESVLKGNDYSIHIYVKWDIVRHK